MGQASYTPEQEVAWYRKIIRNTAIRANRRHARWAKEQLTLNAVTDDGDKVVELLAAKQTFQDNTIILSIWCRLL
ncbi:MAG: hypothetical protein PHT62_11145 [Desulfotomaculaceae bacterium]|nr:hypothetical protein [Desulfotomaculaceae bacterium]